MKISNIVFCETFLKQGAAINNKFYQTYLWNLTVCSS